MLMHPNLARLLPVFRTQTAASCMFLPIASTTKGRYISDVLGGSAAIQERNTVQFFDDPGDPKPRIYKTLTPDRACNFVSWADFAAFAAWSGLRPMSELEFEKACRGPLDPLSGEYAWGTTVIKAQTGHTGADGSGQETATPGDANCCYDNKMGGPVRVGIFAVPGATREAAGASYWGIMELSGNLFERLVSIGNAEGRAFTGLHGNGVLTGNGDADVSNWPGVNAGGAGLRGGSWYHNASYQRVSGRSHATYMDTARNSSIGGRAMRNAPLD